MHTCQKIKSFLTDDWGTKSQIFLSIVLRNFIFHNVVLGVMVMVTRPKFSEGLGHLFVTLFMFKVSKTFAIIIYQKIGVK